MARPSEQQEALAGLLGLGSHSARKSHYPELLARLEELEAERNRYKWLFEHAVHGIFQASLGQGLRAANPALAQMLGYDDPQQVLWSLEDMAGQLFVGGEAEMRRIRALLRERGGLFGYETRLWRRDGSHIEVLMNLLLRHDEEELVEGFVADITERVQAQQRLQTMNEELERRVAERTHELEELNRQLRQARDAAEAANHSRDKYLAAASHDLLQPLNAARLLVDTLRERGLPAAELQLVERTHLALEGAETLLTDLLEIARLDQSAIRPTWTTIPSTNCSLRWPRSSRKSRVPPAWPCVRGSRDWQCAPMRACCRGSCATCSATPAATPSAAACCWGAPAWRQGTPGGVGHWPGHPRRPVAGDLPRVQPTGRRARFRAPWRRARAGHRRPYRRHPRLPHRGAFDSRPRLAVRHRGAAGPQAGAASTRRGDCAGFGW